MPITPSKTTYDPCAPLSWNTTVVILALEKLRRGRVLSTSEKDSMKVVAEQLGLLSEASQIRFDEDYERDAESLPAHLQNSFFTLVAIESGRSSVSSAPDFREASESLHNIYRNLEADRLLLDEDTVRRVKSVCVELLEHLNDQRPNTSFR